MKLTEKQKTALRWFVDNDNARFWPIGFSRQTINRLFELGAIEKELPPSGFGYVIYRASAQGRAALEEVKG